MFGQLGVGNTQFQNVPVQIRSPTNIRGGAVQSIYCGKFTSYCITTSHQLYTWGKNICGFTDIPILTQPTLVTNTVPLVYKVVASTHTTFILGEDDNGCLNIYYNGIKPCRHLTPISSSLHLVRVMSTCSVDQIVLRTCGLDLKVLILPPPFTFFELDVQEVDERLALWSSY